jgi:hypothetical protein
MRLGTAKRLATSMTVAIAPRRVSHVGTVRADMRDTPAPNAEKSRIPACVRVVGIKAKTILTLAALLFPVTAFAAETPHLAFVTEYVRELGVNEDMRARGEEDLAEAGQDKTIAAIRSGTRIVLELNSQVSMMNRMTLNAPFDSVPSTIAKFYRYKIDINQKLIEVATALASGPKPDVDYGAMVAETPKLTATLEYVDRSLFRTTPLIFAMLIADTPDREGHMSRLSITRAQRDALVQSLQISFGDKMDQTNQNYIVSSASVLRDFLTKKGYKCSDDPI